MLTKLRTFASLSRTLGLRWLAFRAAYAFRTRTGLLRRQMPQYAWADRPLRTWLKANIPSEPSAYTVWRKDHSPKFFFENPMIRESKSSVEEAEQILAGEIKFFSQGHYQMGFPPDWRLDPVSRARMDSAQHWSLLSHEGDEDIKFIWEASRFGFVYTLVRAYASTQDERYAEAFWRAIESWAESNPPNTGPNWMDGQEAALRIMAWTFGMYGFARSSASTPQRISLLTVLVAAHAERIYKNTDFAIFTRGNHAITEALGLWLAGLLFPELKDAKKYLSFGRDSLEREGREQIFADGTYAMHSLNYHRFVLHVYLYAIQLGKLNGITFSSGLNGLVAKSIEFISQLIDLRTGQISLYGSNDGALILPLNDCDFTDFRPLLQLGSVITTGRRALSADEWDEDVFWLCGPQALSAGQASLEQTDSSFLIGGVHILHGDHGKAVIRCTDFQARPSHADQLHMDLWLHGHNIACDAGTYLYNGVGMWMNGLAHTPVHNTVTVDSKDQMTKFSRFIWIDWSKGKVLRHTKNLWQGEHDSYAPVCHKRTVRSLEGDRWLVVDYLEAKEVHRYSLHWLLSDVPFMENKNSIHLNYGSRVYEVQTGMTEGDGKFSVVRADPNSTRGWRSRYYGHKEPALSLMLEATRCHACFWTFFGYEGDEVKAEGNTLWVNKAEIELDRS